MILDKDYLLAGIFALLAVVFFSFFIFAPSDQTRDEHARPAYAKDDIRYPYQQAEAKNPKKKKAVAQDSFVTDGSTSAGSSDSSGDSVEDEGANEEPDITDHDPQEEPEIE